MINILVVFLRTMLFSLRGSRNVYSIQNPHPLLYSRKHKRGAKIKPMLFKEHRFYLYRNETRSAKPSVRYIDEINEYEFNLPSRCENWITSPNEFHFGGNPCNYVEISLCNSKVSAFNLSYSTITQFCKIEFEFQLYRTPFVFLLFLNLMRE